MFGKMITRRCLLTLSGGGMSVNENRLGCTLIDINKYALKESVGIKNAIKKAFDSILKEFDEL